MNGPALAATSDLLPPSVTSRSRVVIAQDAESISSFNPRPEKIAQLLRWGLTNLTGRTTPTAAWQSLASTQETIGIKVFSAPGPISGTRPAVAGAIVQGLLSAGWPADRIIVWDKYLADLQRSGFAELARRFGVRLAGSADEGYDEKTFYEMAFLGRLIWGDLEFDRPGGALGRKSFVSKLVTRKINKIINVTPLLNHNLAGVSGNLFSLAMGSVDNSIRFEFGTEQLARAVPEIYALPELGDRVVLNVVDALICQYQGEERMYFHYSAMLGQLRFSTDPVALDVLSIEELNRQRQIAKVPGLTTNFQIYTNAMLLEIGLSDLRRIDVLNVP